MELERIMVVAGGDLERELLDKLLPLAQEIIAADAGAEKLLSWGIIPDIIVGDLDSVSPEVISQINSLGILQERLPEAKNETDLHVALMKALDRKPQEIMIVGGAWWSKI